jgi:hypothetical protein
MWQVNQLEVSQMQSIHFELDELDNDAAEKVRGGVSVPFLEEFNNFFTLLTPTMNMVNNNGGDDYKTKTEKNYTSPDGKVRNSEVIETSKYSKSSKS